MYEMEQIIEIQARQNIAEAMKIYGPEGAKEKIEEVYSGSPRVRDYMLKVFNKVLKGEGLWA